jgi:ABC-type glycerol-3-phosphate transport system permease component
VAGFKSGNAIRKQPGDKALTRFFYLLSFLFAFLCVFPFILVAVSSFTDEGTLVREGYSLWPSKWSVAAYVAALSGKAMPNAYGVTVFVTLFGTLLSLLITTLCSYAISGKMLKYRNAIAFIFYFTMLFSGGIVPWYILISRYLNLRNNIMVYILPALVNPWNMFLLRNFFNTLPESFRESAQIDGAHELTVLARIVIPLSLPAMATIALFYGIVYWNSWMESMLFIDGSQKYEHLYTLQYLIMRIIRNIDSAKALAKQTSVPIPVPPAETIRYATAMLTIGPIIFLYPFLQRYFVAGLKVGGVKG